MNIWITRPELAGVTARGIDACVAWMVKPIYDFTLRGERDPSYPDSEVGWRTPDMEVSSAVRITKTFRPYPELTRQVIRAIHQSLDEDIESGQEFAQWPQTLQRWEELWRNGKNMDDASQGHKHMLLKLDVPWEVWIELANKVADRTDVEICKRLASIDPSLPF